MTEINKSENDGSKFSFFKNVIDYFESKIKSKENQIIKEKIFLVALIITVAATVIYILNFVPNLGTKAILTLLLIAISMMLLIKLIKQSVLTYTILLLIFVLILDPDLIKRLYPFNNENIKVDGKIRLNGKLTAGIKIIPMQTNIQSISTQDGQFQCSFYKIKDSLKFHITYEKLGLDTIIWMQVVNNKLNIDMNYSLKEKKYSDQISQTKREKNISTKPVILGPQSFTARVLSEDKALDSVLVMTINGQFLGVTDSMGFFETRLNVKKGKRVTFIFSKRGYEEKTHSVEIPYAGYRVSLNKAVQN